MTNQKQSSNSYGATIHSSSLQEVKYIPSAVGNVETGQAFKPEQTEPKKKDTLFLYFVVLTGCMPIIVGGGSFVWTSPAIPKLQLNNSEENPIGRPITTTEVSMIAGLPPLMMLLGSLLLGRLSQIIGPKKCLQVIGLGIFVSAVIIAFSTKVILIIVFRCFLYMFYNGTLTVFPVYITEICEDHNRAKYGCLSMVFLPLGNLYSYILGSFFSLKCYSLLLAAPAAYFLIFFFFVPESPVYSLSRGRREECKETLTKLRSNKTEKEIEHDIEKLEDTLKERENAKSGNIFQIFSTKELRFAMVLALGPVLVQNLSGVTIVMAFMAPIFNAAGFSGNYMSIIVGCIKVSTITLTSLVVERTGRRPMLLISSIGTGIPLLILGFFFYLKHINSPLVPSIQFLPLACIVCNVIMYALGLGSIPMAIMGELFTPDMRAAAVSVVTAAMGLCIFVTTSSYPFMEEMLGIHWCVWLYCCICFVGATFIYFMIPETKGKSIPEIQEYLRTRKM
ncbi:facilitated trehalose transporter Tret1-2 homolog [Diabrotica undecimpunctata]|uniref:facilitated trehalose transporter Tret1-2 homolog n=1 Tax=Diabrotica undecimpunctata TaxID=50387 RepID=UPI003B636BD7